MKNAILSRLKKMIRTVYGIPTSGLTPDSTLGGEGLGFDDTFIDDDFRPNANDWFAEILSSNLPPGVWAQDTSLGDASNDVADRSVPSNLDEYRAFMTGLVSAAFDDIVGAEVPSVSAERRGEVAQALTRTLRKQLILDVTADDLDGNRGVIVSTIVRRRM